jgi:hypothetical protein
MKTEPLRKRILDLDVENAKYSIIDMVYKKSGYYFYKDDVKSAVEGYFNEFFECQERDGHLKMSDVLSLKRKWFADVID